jgi:nitroreductase
MNETLQLLNNRKSVRKFADKKISDENISTIIHSAMRSPTAGNQMLYSIIEVDDQDIKDRLVKSCDALIAAQNSVVAAESLGLGSCYIGDIMENYEIHREMFNLPDYTFPITMLCYGYPEGDYKGRGITPRYPQEFIHFKNQYKRFDKTDFEYMVKPIEDVYFKSKNYLGNAENIGQHFYSKKFTSDFTIEMNRSVQKIINIWSGIQ